MNLFEYTYNLVRQIPSGKISTYGGVANALGDIIASRAVGRMMNQNPNADTMPCFKIVYSDGRLGGFGLGIDDKIRRLKNDNIDVIDGEIVDFQNVLFKDFNTDYPLKKLRQEQIDLSKNIIIKELIESRKYTVTSESSRKKLKEILFQNKKETINKIIEYNKWALKNSPKINIEKEKSLVKTKSIGEKTTVVKIPSDIEKTLEYHNRLHT